MNAVAATPVVQHFSSTDNGGSDSDTNSDDSPEYYQPISTADDEEEGDETGHHHLPNGYVSVNGVENGVSSLNLTDDDDEDDEEEERMQEMALERALREDEMRRNAPLTAENAGRVMEAMRGISFGGSPPEWAGRVPEDQWIRQIRTRVGRAPSTSAAADSSVFNESS